MNPDIKKHIDRRRTFAIISHPDAGKTTLTEKLLLYGGAIHLAGAVKAKANQRHTTSDWMDIEKQRGISISTSVLQFEFHGAHINLLDTPGHKDFSEDTYRTLTAVDSAVMLIDAAKGVEPQTRKLFEVCRMRGIPIFTFINKLDRPSRDPIELIDELEAILGIRSCPMNWPIGTGDRFRGVYDRRLQEILFFQRDHEANVKGRLKPKKISGQDDPELIEILRKDDMLETFQSQLELVEVAGDPFDLARVHAGQLSPVFFGSAMNNFGVERFLEHFIELAPTPERPRETIDGIVEASSSHFSGFIFKIQSNMDPQHRDRVAFLRICSGQFQRGMAVKHARLSKEIRLNRPLLFFAQEREIVEEAWPGDIVGLLDTTGDLRIGDTLYTGPKVEFEGIPQFSPEYFCSVSIKDPMKRKQLQKGIDQLSEEGVIQVYRQPGFGDRDPILGAVGALQFEVFQHRLMAEYGVDVKVERLPFQHARWVQLGTGGDDKDIQIFNSMEGCRLLEDRDQQKVILFISEWTIRWAEENRKMLNFFKTAPKKRSL